MLLSWWQLTHHSAVPALNHKFSQIRRHTKIHYSFHLLLTRVSLPYSLTCPSQLGQKITRNMLWSCRKSTKSTYFLCSGRLPSLWDGDPTLTFPVFTYRTYRMQLLLSMCEEYEEEVCKCVIGFYCPLISLGKLADMLGLWLQKEVLWIQKEQ